MSSLWVFPGQGAQQAGMLHQLPDDPIIRDCLQEAADALGEDVMALDTPEALQSTRAVQLCLLIAGVACARLLQARECVPDYVAGLSIGAYPAAVICGALAFDDAMRLVALRGELMKSAYPEGYGMTAVIGLDQAQVEAMIGQVHSAKTPVFLANINADNQMVIAGSAEAMQQVGRQAKAAGAAAVKRLAVSVPSHCALLEAPAQKLAEAFSGIELKTPKVRYLSGSTARPLLNVEKMRDDLAFNMCRVIDWRSTVETAYERGVRLHIELPPGSVLTGLARKVFQQGSALAFQAARLDSLVALSREEGCRTR
ncbi:MULTISPECIES: malonate decarboxylase subunit epsilon [Pseudomonas syringae group]|uniref:Malonyl CoA-acyl carrier protein transacylase n=3 Tax=Pseudomonas syringae group TaxID=136849 RepID=A0AB37QNL4_9PSED|nr:MULTISPECIES: malonate decarboxylase subunit epsilon [Pseudomonas syringae group]KGS16171.1 malonate decarboxylase subunit epsilon [Pseudomonas coronafaciens]KOP57449.1 malonate decarboxylase subunit epsilon [Pseudomonas coronafaciens pv. porri]KOP58892.1 malonate decarboxylase subunit epsilon [Pseudomonas coronafaciens pv. porri]KPX30667.1 Malonyl CoA-acyl carrier protein transacylase [Pseudomonas coronafaciens pv. garcae]KPY24696.1 Malonyl CoA-acyl carrier protein transacylase [Pseudomona